MARSASAIGARSQRHGVEPRQSPPAFFVVECDRLGIRWVHCRYMRQFAAVEVSVRFQGSAVRRLRGADANTPHLVFDELAALSENGEIMSNPEPITVTHL